jgi:hypothetical protein
LLRPGMKGGGYASKYTSKAGNTTDYDIIWWALKRPKRRDRIHWQLLSKFELLRRNVRR